MGENDQHSPSSIHVVKTHADCSGLINMLHSYELV